MHNWLVMANSYRQPLAATRTSRRHNSVDTRANQNKPSTRPRAPQFNLAAAANPQAHYRHKTLLPTVARVSNVDNDEEITYSSHKAISLYGNVASNHNSQTDDNETKKSEHVIANELVESESPTPTYRSYYQKNKNNAGAVFYYG
jgi:hypothetical protein